MKKNRKILSLVVYSSLIIAFSLCILFAQHKKSPIAKNGVIDLTNWDLQKDGIVALDGQWEFYWKQLLTYDDFHGKENKFKPDGYYKIPKVWNDYKIDGKNLPGKGYATYRLKIKTKANETDIVKGLKILTCSTAYKLMINDKLIASNGKVGINKETTKPEYRPQIVSFANNSNEFEIIVQVSNYIYSRGGMWHSLNLGTDKQIRGNREKTLIIDAFLLGVVLIMIFYHLAIYFLNKRDKSLLYFVLLLIILGSRILCTGEYIINNIIPGVGIRWTVLIEYLAICCGTTMWMLFIYQLYQEEFSKRKVKLFVFIAMFITAFIMCTPIRIYTLFLILIETFVIVMFAYILLVVLKSIRNKREGAMLILSGIIIITIGYINDVLYQWNIVESKPGGVNGFSVVVFVFIQAYVLAERYSKSFEEVEKLSTKMLSLNKLKDDFLSNTSHELRTPLHGIISIAEAMIEDSKDMLNDKQKQNLSLIVISGRRLINLVNDIIDYSKLKHHDIRLNKKNVDIQKVVQIVLEMCEHIYVNECIEMKNNIDENVPIIFADEERFFQIIYNLIGNAIKYTEQGAIIISTSQNNNMLEISIEDTGMGIPEDKFEDIFKSYEQLETDLDKQYGGVGLGLNVTKKLILLHGGNIWVKSTIGEGSKFTFTMPISNEPFIRENHKVIQTNTINNTMYKMPSVIKGESEFTILIIDDDYINIASLINILSTEKYSIIAEIEGVKALDIISKNKEIDLVIVDVMMPKISGFEVCKKIREKRSLYDLPVIMLTAQSNNEAILTGLEVGANDFLSKPFDISELKARVKTSLQLKKSVQHALNVETAFLQAQIKPHFLYNALNTIISFCWTDSQKAGDLLIELSNYLRSSFDFRNMDRLIHIKKEIEYVKSYLAIEKARFEEKINCNFDIDEDNLDFMIPPLILQPIVENAIKHGLLKKQEGGNVNIHIKHEDEFIKIIITDNGVGITKEKLTNILKEDGANKRVGIKNINMRMKRIYGYGLSIESEISKGTSVTIKVPSGGGLNID